jgi:hypothetical protein
VQCGLDSKVRADASIMGKNFSSFMK